jgi:hypothetical protein
MNFVSFLVNLKIIDPFFEGYIYVCMMYTSYGPVVVQELEAMMAGGSQVRWGNHMGYLVFPISLKHYSDPLDQVRVAKKVSDSKKASLEGIFTFWSATLLSWLAGPSVCFIFSYYTSSIIDPMCVHLFSVLKCWVFFVKVACSAFCLWMVKIKGSGGLMIS